MSFDFPMQELEQIEIAMRATDSAIQASETVATASCLSLWRDMLTARWKVLMAERDRATSPRGRMIGPGFEYRGAWVGGWDQVSIYTGIMRRLWTDFPERRDAMAKAMGARGTSRVFVAQSIDNLFAGKPFVWAYQHSCQLVEGWYLDTNQNKRHKEILIRAAVEAAGLQWRSEVKLYWTRTQL